MKSGRGAALHQLGAVILSSSTAPDGAAQPSGSQACDAVGRLPGTLRRLTLLPFWKSIGTVPPGPRARSESPSLTSWGACRQGWTRFSADAGFGGCCSLFQNSHKAWSWHRPTGRLLKVSRCLQVNVEGDFFFCPPKPTVTAPES